MLRSAFICKVYSILAMQVTLTALISGVFMASNAVQLAVQRNMWIVIMCMVLDFVLLIPMYIWRQRHPHNIVVLMTWTATNSVTVGLVCSQYAASVVLESLVLTAGVVAGLTAYAFYATKRGKEFDHLGPILFTSLWALILWGFVSMFFKSTPLVRQLYALAGTVIFAIYVVFDTFLLIKRYTIDEYIWASVNLYLDILNLFLRILEILGRRD